MRNDMIFLIILLARRGVTIYCLWRNRAKEMFGGVMDLRDGELCRSDEYESDWP